VSDVSSNQRVPVPACSAAAFYCRKMVLLLDQQLHARCFGTSLFLVAEIRDQDRPSDAPMSALPADPVNPVR